jgi:hypothetical protein
LRSKAAFAPQDTRAPGVRSRLVRWRYACNMQQIGVARNCKACVARCPSVALMCDTSPAFSNRPPRELPPVGFPAAGLCTGCLVHFRHAGPRVMLRGVPCWGHGSSTQRNGDQPGHRPLARDGGQSLGQRARLFPLHPERDRGGAGLDHLDIRPPYQRQCHEGFSFRKGVDNRLYLVPGGGLRLGVGQCGCLGLREAERGKRRQRSCVVARSLASWKKTPPGVRRRLPSFVHMPPLASHWSVSPRRARPQTWPKVRSTCVSRGRFGSWRTCAKCSTVHASSIGTPLVQVMRRGRRATAHGRYALQGPGHMQCTTLQPCHNPCRYDPPRSCLFA